MSLALFVVGAPGVGKTSAVRSLLEPDSYFTMKPKWTVGKEVVAAGHYTGGTFDGADTVPYNGVAKALEYWDENLSDRPLTILDGDRFSNDGVVQWFKHHGHRTLVVYLVADHELIKRRREARGSKQNAAWVRGRATKASRFTRKHQPSQTLLLDSESTPDAVGRAIRRMVEKEL